MLDIKPPLSESGIRRGNPEYARGILNDIRNFVRSVHEEVRVFNQPIRQVHTCIPSASVPFFRLLHSTGSRVDHFKSIIRTLLEIDHYWVQSSFTVDLTLEEKRQIGEPSMPRPEIDLLALNFAMNEVLVVEARSFFDSPGVSLEELAEEYDIPDGRYKLFTSKRYRTIVFNRLLLQLCEHGMANANTKISLVLAAGNVYKDQTAAIQELFLTRDFVLWSPSDIKDKVIALAKTGYENDPAIITAKILLR